MNDRGPDAERTSEDAPPTGHPDIDELRPWFHNLHLPDGRQTSPGHALGDFPRFKWRRIEPSIPGDLQGWTALDLGCKAGFYSIELALRGAEVTAADVDPHFLRQTRWAAEHFGVLDRLELRRASVYGILHEPGTFDIVWFMGVLNHLRYPMLALDLVARATRRIAVVQSLTVPHVSAETLADHDRGGPAHFLPAFDPPPDLPHDERHRLATPEWPGASFVPGRLAGDATSWWVPNRSRLHAMLQAAGLEITAAPDPETFVCRPRRATETPTSILSPRGETNGVIESRRADTYHSVHAGLVRDEAPGLLGDVAPRAVRGGLRECLGVSQWFHYRDHETVLRAVDLMHQLGVRHLRTGILWADAHRPDGPAWHEWMMRQLEPFDVLLSIWRTPPSLSETGRTQGPPRRLPDYADFIEEIIRRHGDQFAELELWNEPNSTSRGDFVGADPGLTKFAAMVGEAAQRAKQHGRRTVLGGSMPVDVSWLQRMSAAGVLEHVDVVGIHAFPGMWWNDHPNWDREHDWRGWEEKLARLKPLAGDREIWITETGLATVNAETGERARHDMQRRRLEQVAWSNADRMYWHSLIDLDPSRDAPEGFHEDEHEYHLGLVTHDGEPKPAFESMQTLLREVSVECDERHEVRQQKLET